MTDKNDPSYDPATQGVPPPPPAASSSQESRSADRSDSKRMRTSDSPASSANKGPKTSTTPSPQRLSPGNISSERRPSKSKSKEKAPANWGEKNGTSSPPYTSQEATNTPLLTNLRRRSISKERDERKSSSKEGNSSSNKRTKSPLNLEDDRRKSSKERSGSKPKSSGSKNNGPLSPRDQMQQGTRSLLERPKLIVHDASDSSSSANPNMSLFRNSQRMENAQNYSLSSGQKMQRMSREDRAFQALIEKQQKKLPACIAELERDGRKTGHWIWWVMPSTKPGLSEPGEPTYVNEETVFNIQ